MANIVLKKIPDKYLKGVIEGKFVVHNCIIKNAETGKIVDHLEDVADISTQALQSLSPILDIVKIVQNKAMLKKMDNINKANKVNQMEIGAGIIMIGGFLFYMHAVRKKDYSELNKIVQDNLNNETKKEIIKTKKEANEIIYYNDFLISDSTSKEYSNNIGSQIMKTRSFLESQANEFRENINYSFNIDFIISLYISYNNLISNFIGSKEFNKNKINSITSSNYKVYNLLKSKEFLEKIYLKYICDINKIYTEDEINNIIDDYCDICEKYYTMNSSLLDFFDKNGFAHSIFRNSEYYYIADYSLNILDT